MTNISNHPSRSVIAMPVVLGVVTLLASVIALFRPNADGPVAAVFPPWWNARQTIGAASSAGPVIRFGAASFIVVVAQADASRQRLRDAGAWLLLDPESGLGCSSVNVSSGDIGS